VPPAFRRRSRKPVCSDETFFFLFPARRERLACETINGTRECIHGILLQTPSSYKPNQPLIFVLLRKYFASCLSWGGYNHWSGLLDWIGLLDWTTGLDRTTGLDYWTYPDYKMHFVQCRTEAKRTYSLSYFANTAPYISRAQRSRANKLHPRWLCLNPVEFKQALSTHELYQLESNVHLLESTFTKLSIDNLVPERIRRALHRNQSPGFVEAQIVEEAVLKHLCLSMVEDHC